jgi:hypothetical protein
LTGCHCKHVHGDERHERIMRAMPCISRHIDGIVRGNRIPPVLHPAFVMGPALIIEHHGVDQSGKKSIAIGYGVSGDASTNPTIGFVSIETDERPDDIHADSFLRI